MTVLSPLAVRHWIAQWWSGELKTSTKELTRGGQDPQNNLYDHLFNLSCPKHRVQSQSTLDLRLSVQIYLCPDQSTGLKHQVLLSLRRAIEIRFWVLTRCLAVPLSVFTVATSRTWVVAFSEKLPAKWNDQHRSGCVPNYWQNSILSPASKWMPRTFDNKVSGFKRWWCRVVTMGTQ